jgi:nucleoside-diphosphate-sugar epimerase
VILLTGGSGLVGRSVLDSLRKSQPVRAALRQLNVVGTNSLGMVDYIQSSLSPYQNWSSALSGVSVVVHCAARVHVMNEKSSDPLAEFRLVNVDGTLNLARQASEAGVRRFVFISSIKVNGEFTELGYPFTADQMSAPIDPYGVSKHEAEMGLKDLSKATGMEVVIIRSPLVYGPGVKANFLSMMNWLNRDIPLPFGSIKNNRRSFVFIDNLVSLIVTCISHPSAANQIFLVSDDEDLSTAGLLQRIALAIGRRAKLISVPAPLIIIGANLLGRSDIAQRLCGSLQINMNKTKDLLGWSPPVSVDEGLRKTAEYYLKTKS